jgi:hypothetical protein
MPGWLLHMVRFRLAAIKGDLLAKPNYQFEKRQRDLAKKRKQEEKQRQKLANKAPAADGAAEKPPEAAPPGADNTPAVPADGKTNPEA